MLRVALSLCGGKYDTYIVVPRVVEPDRFQDEHGQGEEDTTGTHRIQVSKGGLGIGGRRENPS